MLTSSAISLYKGSMVQVPLRCTLPLPGGSECLGEAYDSEVDADLAQANQEAFSDVGEARGVCSGKQEAHASEVDSDFAFSLTLQVESRGDEDAAGVGPYGVWRASGTPPSPPQTLAFRHHTPSLRLHIFPWVEKSSTPNAKRHNDERQPPNPNPHSVTLVRRQTRKHEP